VLELEGRLVRAPLDTNTEGETSACRASPLLSVSGRGNELPTDALDLCSFSLIALCARPKRYCSITSIAACNSARSGSSLSLPRRLVASSSPKVGGERGEEISAEDVSVGDVSVEVASVEEVELSIEDWRISPNAGAVFLLSISEPLTSETRGSGVGYPAVGKGDFEIDRLLRCLLVYGLKAGTEGIGVLETGSVSVSSRCWLWESEWELLKDGLSDCGATAARTIAGV